MRHRWDEHDDQTVRTLYPELPGEWVAAVIGVAVRKVYARASALGIRKSDAFHTSTWSARLRRGEARGRRTRFRPGHRPWNAGLRGWHAPGVERTWFKRGEVRGRAAELKAAVGTLRINADGYLERKVNDGPDMRRRWVAVHRIVWEQAHGVIPRGHVVAFRGGRTTVEAEITADRLELVSRQDWMRRHSVHALPNSVRRAVIAKGALQRTINRMLRESSDERGTQRQRARQHHRDAAR